MPRWLLAGSLILISLVSLISLWDLTSTTSLGENDFVGYWSATYLFHNGQNPYDPELMELIQNTKLVTHQNSTIMAWNPPSLFVVLLPLARLSFLQAKFVWLITNLIIVITAVVMLANIYRPIKNTKFILVSLLFAMIFPPVTSGLYMGQVTFLVFFGLVTCMALIKQGQWFWAGAILLLTTIKPHMAVLPAVYFLIHMIQQRQFNGLVGLFISGMLCVIILCFFRPEWVQDLIELSAVAPVNWATPTIGGLLRYTGVTEFAQYLIFLFLPLPFILAKFHTKFSLEFSIALLTLITVPVTFFGWSYDQTMLMIPIVQIFSWMAQYKKQSFNTLIIIAIAIAMGFNVYQRLISINDVYYVWVPLFWWFLFGLTWRHSSPINEHG